MTAATTVETLCINTLRTLAMDAVQRANSGHPGAPMGLAPLAFTLWTRYLRHNPRNPAWPDRDRFVLSAGHASMLLYGLLHLTGYDLALDEIKQFRQWGSRTPGHPEYRLTPGVEATTGPLGQGFGMGVGMAIAERLLAERFNRPGHTVIDHYTYAICSDGDLMEGVSAEAASIAGFLGLGKLIYLYDDNHVTIEGSTSLAFTEDVGRRFEAYGWHVQHIDGQDTAAVAAAIEQARAETARPSLIIARTTIAYGSPGKAGSAEAHGTPLGADEVRATKEALGWPVEPEFYIPAEALAEFRRALARGEALEREWQARMAAYASAYPAEACALQDALAGRLPDGWEDALPIFSVDQGPMATRSASGRTLNAIAPVVTSLVGGSADLAPSNNTYLNGMGDVGPGSFAARNLHFGVREHAMGAITNGINLHGGLRAYAGTFLVFSDYMRPAIRMAAIMGTPSVFVFTHDSIGVGEDGPTHQPIEHLASLRSIPGLTVIRPADANETAAAWKVALESRGPVALALTRQNVPVLDDVETIRAGVPRGAYIVREPQGTAPDALIIATGSEVAIALAAAETLDAEGVAVRVVSMPSWELFAAQPRTYRDSVIPPAVRARVTVEAGATLGWERFAGDHGRIIGIDRFGASAPGKVVMEEFGFTAGHVAQAVRDMLEHTRRP
ncbi:MAG: transketolase [Dehalococcoidia bacterium]